MEHARIESLVEQAKLLTPQEREILAEEIMATVIPTPAEWQAAWTKECEDRIAAVDRGEMEVYDFDDVMVKLRAKLKQT